MASTKIKPNKDQKRIADLTADLQRIQADFVNFKRRAEEEKLRYTRYGRESAIMALLPVVDNIERAMSHIPHELAKHDFALGVRSIAKQMEDALKGLGVAKIVSVGQPFDPSLHEAISLEDTKGKKEFVIEELQPGYAMDGEVIRHAMVKVGRK